MARPLVDTSLQAVTAARDLLAERIVRLLRRHDPKVLARLGEVGVVNREWLESPGEEHVELGTPLKVLERSLASLVERRPSLLASLGLSAVEVLSLGSGSADGTASTRTLTVAFTDLEGFTRFTARAGDAAAAQLLREHYRRSGPVVRSRHGRVVKRLGDGLLLTFGSCDDAVRAALELADAPHQDLAVRVGMHCGEVLCTRDDVVGHVVNLAARITELAHGGEVLVSNEVRDRLDPERLGVRVGRSRKRRLKGVPDRVAVCPVSVA